MGFRVSHQDIGTVGSGTGRSLSCAGRERKGEDNEDKQQWFSSQTIVAQGPPQLLVRTCCFYVKPFEFAHCIAPPIVYDMYLSEYRYSAGSCVRSTLGPDSGRCVIRENTGERKTVRQAAILLKKDVNKWSRDSQILIISGRTGMHLPELPCHILQRANNRDACCVEQEICRCNVEHWQ